MAEATKARSEQLEEAIRRSVETPEDAERSPGIAAHGGPIGLLMFQANYADGIEPWGTAPASRDAKLRQFLTQESFAGSAFGAITQKYAQMSWKVTGGERTKLQAHRLLNEANWGQGWEDFVSALALDYLSQDRGAFVEIIRRRDSPDSAVVGLRAMDAAFCWPTGDPEFPVYFWDHLSGKLHKMRWYQVHHIREMPFHHPTYHGLQLSAASRVLRYAQVWRNIAIYQEEKTGGRHTRQLHFVAGATREEIDAAITMQRQHDTQAQLQRFSMPPIVTMLDPTAEPKVATLELAGMPENFDLAEQWRHYVTVLALALGTDFQELAPLPGGNLGTSAQSVILDKKASQKGMGLFRKRIAGLLNRHVLPDNVEFEWDEQDLDEEMKDAQVRSLRASTRSTMVNTGEVDTAGARQMALDDGDMDPDLFERMNAEDVTPNALRGSEVAAMWEQIQRQLQQPGPGMAMPQAPIASGAQGATQALVNANFSPEEVAQIINPQSGGGGERETGPQADMSRAQRLQNQTQPDTGEDETPIEGEEQGQRSVGTKQDRFAGPSEERREAEEAAAQMLAGPLERVRKRIVSRLLDEE